MRFYHFTNRSDFTLDRLKSQSFLLTQRITPRRINFFTLKNLERDIYITVNEGWDESCRIGCVQEIYITVNEGWDESCRIGCVQEIFQ